MDKIADRRGSYILCRTMNGDVRVEVLDEKETPIVFFIIPSDDAQTVAIEILQLANRLQ